MFQSQVSRTGNPTVRQAGTRTLSRLKIQYAGTETGGATSRGREHHGRHEQRVGDQRRPRAGKQARR